MTIKQQGGIFGRNPTFNEVDVDADLTVDTNTLYVNSLSNEVCVGQLTSINAGKFNVKTDSAHNGISVTLYADNYYSYYGTNAAGSQTFYVRGDGISNFQGAMTVEGQINNTGNHVISSGNLVINTSGQGIDFSATSDASGSTSELFDDYEEGTWTPVLEATDGAFTSVTYDTLRGGRYTKIGNIVHVQCYMRTDALDNTVGRTGDVVIGGLPYSSVTASTGIDGHSALSVGITSSFAGEEPSMAFVGGGGQTQIQLMYRTAADGSTSNLDPSDLGTGANANVILVSGTYTAA